ncbi:MAG: glycosyl transferase [Oligoflexia bacterium]
MSSFGTFEFCTLFDQGFLSRGLALIESIEKNFKDFRIHVLCLDGLTHTMLERIANPRVVPLRLSTLENSRPALLEAKRVRTRQEYCWTLTAPWLEYCIRSHGLSHCIYLDADIWFISPDVSRIKAELQSCSVFITPHHYAPRYDQSRQSGIFCVQFVFIRNDREGMKILSRWAEQCLEWCFARQEEGRFGDQKYLDEWPALSPSVKVSEDLGMGVAPWNAIRFDVQQVGSAFQVREIETGQVYPLAFYHFHGLRLGERQALLTKRYRIPESYVGAVYLRYLGTLTEIEAAYSLPFMAVSLFTGFKDRLRSWLYRDEYPSVATRGERGLQDG